jgi:multidrug efflux pump subunit AcrB
VSPSGPRIGLAGLLAGGFLHSRITPLLVITSVLLGIGALLTLPREEEPQIQVPMVDVTLEWPGATAEQVESQLTNAIERRLSQIQDLEYLYSTSREDGASLIARFNVGSNPENALVRVRTRLDEANAALPPGARVAQVAPRSIDDVPVLVLALSSARRANLDQSALRRVGLELARELRRTPGVALVEVRGGSKRVVRVMPDPARMAAAGVPIDRLLAAVSSAGRTSPAGDLGRANTRDVLRIEDELIDAAEVRSLAIGADGGRVLRLDQVATVVDGPDEIANYVFLGDRSAPPRPAVTLEVSKLPGVNATTLTNTLRAQVKTLTPALLGSDVALTTTRDYGRTAQHKSDDLMFHLLLATLSVITLIGFALGRREAMVVAVAIPVTLALTLFIYRFLGYTLNRVTLFALIFSIGILVDDAIVVVENIARHFGMSDERPIDVRVVDAVDEVGQPTILATATVIAAILPLAFVGGLMGPYMKPIPVGGSLAMIFSLLIALVVSPWASRILLRAPRAGQAHASEGRLDRLYRRGMGALLDRPRLRRAFLAGIAGLFVLACSLVAFRAVRVKMLPFDNKSEFDVLVDLPPGSPVERTLALAGELGAELDRVPEVEDYVVYAGVGGPVTFNGLVRHYDLRTDPRLGTIQVRLVEPERRKEQSHAIARRVRPALERVAQRYRARLKVVEIPPGPPVLSTLVAEIYGPDTAGQRALAHRVWDVFRAQPDVVDTDLMLTEGQPRTRVAVDRERAALAGIPAGAIVDATSALYGGRELTGLRTPVDAEPVPVTLRLASQDRADLSALGLIRLGSPGVPLSELTFARRDAVPPEIFHKNQRRVVYVLGDVAGRLESPVYAIAALDPKLAALRAPDGNTLAITRTAPPTSDERYGMKWDGEWQITYEVFRDMGSAFAVVLVLIYVLTVGWFKSFTTPFVIMLPIPLSLIGILPAHALLGAFFTATSMIGFIAGAGISVRNSIILVDFIEFRRRQGLPLRDAVIEAGAVRFRPMVLTAAAVVVGAGVILLDPIFQGLAVALIGGEIAATLLSRTTVPIFYYLVRRERAVKGAAS